MIESFKIIKYESLDSTQEEAKRLLKEQKIDHGYAITTDMQVKGKGRYDRKWTGEKGDLACTFVLKPEKNINLFTQISFVAAIAVGDITTKHLKECAIKYKWPNDIMINNKKVSGILLELVQNKHLLVGIGINVISNAEKELQNIYSLSNNNQKLNYATILQDLCEFFVKRYNQWNQMGFDAIKNLWTANAMNLEKKIKANYLGNETEGYFIGIDDSGSMILQENGKKKLIKIGEIFFK